jgi:uncharacterized protein YbaR (Trm112 family)
MKHSTIELLRCPDCQGVLSLPDDNGKEVVDQGNLSCSSCEKNFLISNGIAHFISPQDLEGLNLRFARFYKRFSRFETILDKLSFLPMGGERKARKEILFRIQKTCKLDYITWFMYSPDMGGKKWKYS